MKFREVAKWAEAEASNGGGRDLEADIDVSELRES
jgi:hypothetical protein